MSESQLSVLRGILLCGSLLGCASSPRFKDAPPIWRVDDDQHIAEPSAREYEAKEYFAKVFFMQRLDRTLELRDLEPAHNANSLEEVPDSTWFQNRIGVRKLAPAEVARGHDAGGPPRPPFSVVSGKVGGDKPGFVMKDVTGRRFIVKFDSLRNPEQQTAAGVIVNRALWAAGYNVPSDHVFTFARRELELAPGARYIDPEERSHPFTLNKLDEILATSPRSPGDHYRALASQLLEGEPKGGFSPTGTRDDDPNDRVRHEHRRELRGLRILAAWLGHTDIKEDNTLDMYVERNGRRFLVHYLLDFSEALAGHAAEKDRPEDGWEHFIDWEMQTKATFTFGLWQRPWEEVRETRWPAIGAFTAEPFDPRAWREAYPFWPFAEMDAVDAYWGAKLVMRFERAHLEAIVAEGKLSEPEAARYLVDTLLARRDAIGRAYLDALSPLDELLLTPGRLCMTDLALRYGLVKSGTVEWLGKGSDVRLSRALPPSGRLCVRVSEQSDAYTVFRMRVRRPDGARPAMELHFKAGPKPRILGLIRDVG